MYIFDQNLTQAFPLFAEYIYKLFDIPSPHFNGSLSLASINICYL